MLPGMRKYPAENWKRLGRWVYDNRVRAGYTDTKEWADEVGRSTRQLLGLERGEQVGAGTIESVARALEVDPGVLFSKLAEGGLQISVAQEGEPGDLFGHGDHLTVVTVDDAGARRPVDEARRALVREMFLRDPKGLAELLREAARILEEDPNYSGEVAAPKGGDGHADDTGRSPANQTAEPGLPEQPGPLTHHEADDAVSRQEQERQAGINMPPPRGGKD